MPIVRKSLTDGSNAVGSTIQSFLNLIPTAEDPPTFNRTNKFTRGFQTLIDSYGVASYREVNPGLYTIITFPFLFAVMFGDLGHGIILTLFAAWMVIWERSLSAKKSNNEIWNIFFAGRYIILLMGMFSMYTGFIYNDLFSKSLNIFGSGWKVQFNASTVMSNKMIQLSPRNNFGETYPIGLDPIWQLAATNKILFLNSYKMKLSIIFGVIHMIFGVSMSVINMVHFRKKASILLEFLPQILFLVLLFGYMVFMMFLKWIMYTDKTDVSIYTPACAPSILILFINMMLFKNAEPLMNCTEFMFIGQGALQTVFLVIGLLCIPWMLLGKPLYLLCSKKSDSHVSSPRKNRHHFEPHSCFDRTSCFSQGKSNGVVSQDIELTGETQTITEPAPAAGGHDHEDESFGEIFTHQAIHTIEYVLSTISHTASYLRLWALSLAHARKSP